MRVIWRPHRTTRTDTDSTADVEVWVSRIADLVLKASAIGERYAEGVASLAQDQRIARLQGAVSTGRSALQRLATEGRRVSS